MGRGLATGDLDEDGDVDLVISHVRESLAMLSNETKSDGNWIALRLIGRHSSRDPVGATVRITAGGRVQIRQRRSGTSYASSSDPRLFFGLGKQTAVQSVEIQWPRGTTQQLDVDAINTTLTVVEPLPDSSAE